MSTETALQPWRFVPETQGQAMEMAVLLSKSDLVPVSYRGKPGDIIVAYEYGRVLGFSWVQALKAIAVINGVAALWGDAIPALILRSGECEVFEETFEGEEPGKPYADTFKAVCRIKRKGLKNDIVRSFSVADAKAAKLWGKTTSSGKDTPWITYPKRMLQMRARGFAARDSFADKLAGLSIAEEAMDYTHAINTTEYTVAPAQPPALVAFAALPEPLRDKVEEMFALLNMGKGARLVAMNRWLGGPDDMGSPEDAAQAMLEWGRDEFARRKTGQPRADNNKMPLVQPTTDGLDEALTDTP